MSGSRDASGRRRFAGVVVAVLTVTALLVVVAPAATAVEQATGAEDVAAGQVESEGGSGTMTYTCVWAIAAVPFSGGAPHNHVCVQVSPAPGGVTCQYYVPGVDTGGKLPCRYNPTQAGNTQGVGVSAGTIPGTGVMVWPHCHMPYMHAAECGLNDQYMVGPGS